MQEVFQVAVEKIATPSYNELVAQYDFVSHAWDEGRCRIELHESLRNIEPFIGNRIMFLKRFDRSTTSEAAIEWASKHGYRAPFPCEREAFASQLPSLLGEGLNYVVDSGITSSSRNDEGGLVTSAPVISCKLTVPDARLWLHRSLGGCWSAGAWNPICRFLLVAK